MFFPCTQNTSKSTKQEDKVWPLDHQGSRKSEGNVSDGNFRVHFSDCAIKISLQAVKLVQEAELQSI